MTALELVNLALIKIGVTQGVEALDEDTREAYTAGAIYDHALRYTLRRFNWPFATKYVTAFREPFDFKLVAGAVWDDDWANYVQTWSSTATYQVGDVVQNDDLLYYCTVGHTNQEPPNASYWAAGADEDTEPPEVVAGGDWTYAYRWPSDCLRARRLVDEATGRKFNADPIPFKEGRDANERLIWTNQQAAVLEYTLLDCSALYADDLWIDAFTWKLAGDFASAHARNGKTQDACMAMFERALFIASTAVQDEQQQEKPGEAEWLTARGGATSPWQDIRRARS